MEIIYLSIEQIVETHGKTVDVSGGGEKTALNLDNIKGTLEHIKNDDYYPTFEKKLTQLIWGLCKFHAFQDGNKRIAISAGAQFLLLNGYLNNASAFLAEMENIIYNVANGNISKELLEKIIEAIIYDEMENESLKLKIITAITSD